MIAQAVFTPTIPFHTDAPKFSNLSAIENMVQDRSLSSTAYAVVVVRWLKSNLYRPYDPIWTASSDELCEILNENCLRDDLLFSADRNSVGLVLWRPTANHLHVAMRDMLQEISRAKTSSGDGKQCLIRQILSVQIGWAVSSHQLNGMDVYQKAQQRSFSYENVM